MHNIIEIINERLIGQYKDSPVIIAFLSSLSSEYNFLHSEIKRVVDERYFDNAKNVNLDIIGKIVGVGREVTDFVETDYFSFLQDPTGKGFDSLTETVKAGRYRSADENTVTTRKLNDNEYRILINAKILKNISNITSNDVLLITRQILELMYPNNVINVEIIETGNASFQVKVNYILSPAEKSFIASLDLIPRPVGVRIDYIYEDVDFPIEVSLSSVLEDSVVGIAAGAPANSILVNNMMDSITSISSNAIVSSNLPLTLEDSAVMIQVAPPGTISLTPLFEDSVVSISTEIEQSLSSSIVAEDSVTSISSGVVNASSLSVVQSNSSVTGSMTVADPVPLAPTGLTVTVPTNNSLTIDFNSSSYATGYKIYRDLVEIADIAVLSYVDNTLLSGTTYSYTVSAYNAQGESSESAAVQGTTSQPYLFEGTALVPGNAVDMDVWGTFDYSIDGGASFSSVVAGSPFSIIGNPTGDVFIKATTGITQIKLQNDYFDTIKIREGTGSFTNCTYMFGPIFQNLGITSIDITELNTSNVTIMNGMFSYCPSLTTLDVSGLDTSSVTDMSAMFRGSSGLTSLNLSSFVTASVSAAISFMFDGCSSLTSLDLSSFDTSLTTTFDYMFLNTSSLSTVTVNSLKFTDNSAFSMISMFEGSAISSFDFTGFDFSGMISMQGSFKNASLLTCVTNFNTTNATNKTDAFLSNTALVAPNSTEVTDLLDANGANYVNAGACP